MKGKPPIYRTLIRCPFISLLPLKIIEKEIKEYFEKIMQDYNLHRNGRSLKKYCQDEAVDYQWLLEFKKHYPVKQELVKPTGQPPMGFVPLNATEAKTVPAVWQIRCSELVSPEGETFEIKGSNLSTVVELLRKLA